MENMRQRKLCFEKLMMCSNKEIECFVSLADKITLKEELRKYRKKNPTKYQIFF